MSKGLEAKKRAYATDGLWQRKGSRYWWTTIGGKRVSTGCVDRDAAVAARAMMERRTLAHRKVRRGTATIYFVQAGEGGPIKIGIATNLKGRLAIMRSDNPAQIKTLWTILGTMDEEHNLHRWFAHLRVRGEWFTPGPELLEFIEHLSTICARAPSETSQPIESAA